MSLYYYSAETIYDGLLKLKFTEKSLLTCLSCGSCTLCPVRMIYSEIFAISITNNYLSSFGCFNVVDRSLGPSPVFLKKKRKTQQESEMEKPRWWLQDGGYILLRSPINYILFLEPLRKSQQNCDFLESQTFLHDTEPFLAC